MRNYHNLCLDTTLMNRAFIDVLHFIVVFNNEHNLYPEMNVKQSLACSKTVHFTSIDNRCILDLCRLCSRCTEFITTVKF